MAEIPAETARPTGRARIEPPDLSEKGGVKDGQPQRSDERLFMQLLAFGECDDARGRRAAISPGPADAVVVYEDLNDPRGIAVLTVSTGSEHVRRRACGRALIGRPDGRACR